jgi:hypothetical protein
LPLSSSGLFLTGSALKIFAACIVASLLPESVNVNNSRHCEAIRSSQNFAHFLLVLRARNKCGVRCTPQVPVDCKKSDCEVFFVCFSFHNHLTIA